MICRGCGCVYCPEPPDEPDKGLPQYCSGSCQKQSQRRRARAAGARLPERQKRARNKTLRAQEQAWAKVERALRADEIKIPQPCPSGKVRHQGKRSAVESARTQARLHYDGMPSWLNVYLCPMCDGWHLTSKPQRARRVPS